MKYHNLLTLTTCCLLLGTNIIPSYAADNNYFTVKITYPNKKTISFQSSQSLDLTSIPASSKATTIKLTKVVRNGQILPLDQVTFSLDYLNNSKHTNSLIASKSTLSLTTSYLKSAAYKSSARLTVRMKTAAVEAVDPAYILPLKETKYKSSKSLLSFSHLKYGLYGTKKKGLQLSKKDLSVNNKSLAKSPYAWWTSEYKYINKKWCATSMMLSMNYPYQYDATKNYSAYHFAINRNQKGYIQSLTLQNVYTYQGTNSYGEIWKKATINDIDPTSQTLAKNWALKDTFKYSYVLKTPTLSKLTPKKKAIKVTWKKDNDADGYQITYSTSKNFKKAKTMKINSYKTVNKTISKLSSQKTYYVKMRSYGIVDEKTYYSSYSKVLHIKTK